MSELDPEGLGARRLLLRRLAQASFIDFVRSVAPWFIVEEVHIAIAEKLEKVANGEIDRLMLFMPPRTGKSLLCSMLFPAWWMGRFPSDKVMSVAYEHELAVSWGRTTRNLIRDPDYQEVFPGVELSGDSKAAGRWSIAGTGKGSEKTQQGEYIAAGIRGGIAGKGWNLGMIDDPISEQDALSDTAKEFVRNWYGPGFYTRRQPDRNAIILIMTRWAKDDLAGFLLEQMLQNRDDAYADRWDTLNIPAILEGHKTVDLLNSKAREAWQINQGLENGRARKEGREAKRVPVQKFREGASFAPRRWPIRELMRTKSNMPAKWWQALYQGNPAEEEGHILKRAWWQKWTRPTPPPCEMIVAAYDTAFEEKETDDFSARTTWGVFRSMVSGRYCVILLERMNKRLAYPDLVDEALHHYRDFEPDLILIEKRASGHSLLQTLKRKGLPAKQWLPPGGRHSQGKLPRAHAASDVLEEGIVYYMDRDWAEGVVDQCAAFPYDTHDDMVDTVTMVLLWLRKSFLAFEDEETDDDETPRAGSSPAGGLRRIYG
jgi:predicted phage terminase large subunit-like protein